MHIGMGLSLADAVAAGRGGDKFARFANLSGDWSGGDLSARRNVWQYTEDLASNRYSAIAPLAKGTDTVSVNGVTLTRGLCTSSQYPIPH